MRARPIAAAFAAVAMALFASGAHAETIDGQTAMASYQAPGLCAENDRATGLLRLEACARKAEQDFHMETFNDIAQQVSWQKIMNGKNCLQAGWNNGRSLYTERCAISTWSKAAFWSIASSGDLYSQEQYCPYREDKAVAAGAALVGAKCRWFEGAELYPAIITRSAKVGPQTLASHIAGQDVKAIVIENGFSGGNLVASEGAFLTVDKSGRVSATKGGYIIAGGAGYIIRGALAKTPGAIVLSPSDYADRQPDDYSPRNMDFFKEKDRGRISYDPR